MDLPAGPSRIDRSRSPRKSTKTHTLADVELLNILNDVKCSDEESDDDFDECISVFDGDD
jgi:hypothetical protein